MNNPSITVLMPVYNGEKYLCEAIESILNQTYTNFEFLIINDGSTDQTEKIILDYNDPRIRYVKNIDNLKLIATLNKGIMLSKGKYIVRMDADDISLPNRLQKQFEFMELHSNIALCGSWFELLDGKGSIAKYVANHNEIMLKMLYQCHICHPSVIMRKTAIETFPVKFDPLFVHAEDYDFFTRIGTRYKLANIQEVLLKYRIHEHSVSQKNKNIQHKNSTIVKQNLFAKIGLSVSENELDLFKSIMQHEYECSEKYIKSTRIFLEKFWTANVHTSFFDHLYLRNYLSKLWLNVTYNSSRLGKSVFDEYKRSVLLYPAQINFMNLLKFYIKARLNL